MRDALQGARLREVSQMPTILQLAAGGKGVAAQRKRRAPGLAVGVSGGAQVMSYLKGRDYRLWLRPFCSGEPTWTMAQRKPMSSRLSRSSRARRVPGLSQ